MIIFPSRILIRTARAGRIEKIVFYEYGAPVVSLDRRR
jgi:hypothetical protein